MWSFPHTSLWFSQLRWAGECHVLIPSTWEHVIFWGKGIWQIKVKDLRWGDSPGFSRWAQWNHEGPYETGRRAHVRERSKDATLMALEMEEGP